MLHQILPHNCYLTNLENALATFSNENLAFYDQDIQLFKLLNLDSAVSLFEQTYSHTGAPGKDPTMLFRSMLLASRNGWTPKQLTKQLTGHWQLRALVGLCPDEKTPGTSTFYDFMHRLVPLSEKAKLLKPFGSKKKPKNIGGDGKLPDNKPKSRTAKLVEKILDGKFNLDRTPERLLQLIFKNVAVNPSVEVGLIEENPIVSVDGTCLRTGSSSKGTKVCDCVKKGIFQCQCKRKFSDPLANIGWDSHEKCYFYGYTAFFSSTYSTKFKKDLPLSLRLVDAKRHDSLTALIALQEYKELYPELPMSAFIADSAMDNHPTYYLLNTWKIPAYIDLNNRNAPRLPVEDITFDEKGTPICPAGLPMSYYGKWKRNFKERIKFRCPVVTKKKGCCPLNKPCSSSSYGRTVYVHPEDDLRLYPDTPRQSSTFKKIFKQRTACERINKQVLIDHHLETIGIRTKHRNFFYCVMACIDIHLKAQLSIASA